MDEPGRRDARENTAAERERPRREKDVSRRERGRYRVGHDGASVGGMAKNRMWRGSPPSGVFSRPAFMSLPPPFRRWFAVSVQNRENGQVIGQFPLRSFHRVRRSRTKNQRRYVQGLRPADDMFHGAVRREDVVVGVRVIGMAALEGGLVVVVQLIEVRFFGHGFHGRRRSRKIKVAADKYILFL